MERGKESEKSRRRLIASADFVALGDAGHDLKDGVVLTSVSDAPFEMSFKCINCAAVFWFENLSWENRRIAAWRLNDESRDALANSCIAAAHAAHAEVGEVRALYTHP
jgi:hypothetical protein